MLKQIVDSLALSGSILVMLFSLTAWGIVTQDKEVYQTFGSAFCAFATGKKLSDQEKP